jgi:two-component system, OmpR family, sensor kinase
MSGRLEGLRGRLPIKVKLAVVTAGLTFAILCLFAVVIGAVAEQRIGSAFDDELRASAADLVEKLNVRWQDGDVRYDPAALRFADTADVEVELISARGRVLYPRAAPLPLGPAFIEGVNSVGDYRVSTRPLVIASHSLPAPLTDPLGDTFDETVGFVKYARPLTNLKRTVNRVRLFLAFGVIGGTLLAFLAGLLVARRAMRPIAGLTHAAREVARTRDPDITLPRPTANDEVSELARTFEDMLRELGAARSESEAALARQRDFVADASHELRTPLTSILANLELLDSELEGEQKEMAGSALRSSRRMRRLVADLLLLARADAGRVARRTPVDLSAIAREAAAEAGALAVEHPVSLDIPAQVAVYGVEDDLHRLAGNLVENAFIHTPSGTPVTVSVREEDGTAVLEVSDRGPGIPPQLRERVFDRFARGGGDRAPAGGSGLGLAIVRAVTAAHGGTVELGDAEGGGARFTVRLPAAEVPVPAAQTSTTTGRTIGRRRSRS